MFSTENFKVATTDGRNFTLLEPVTFTRYSGEVITIPAGAQSDGASTPQAVWPTLPPFGKYWRAAYLHDFLYRYTHRSKVECDDILREAMAVIGVDAFEMDVIYQGVALAAEDAFAADRGQKATWWDRINSALRGVIGMPPAESQGDAVPVTVITPPEPPAVAESDAPAAVAPGPVTMPARANVNPRLAGVHE